MREKISITIIISFLLFSCSSTADRTSKVEPLLMENSRKGKIVGINLERLHYLFRIKTHGIKWKKYGKNSYFFFIDNKRVIKLTNGEINDSGSSNMKLKGKALLAYYNRIELDHYKDRFGRDIKFTGRFMKLRNSDILYWTVDLPENVTEIPRKHICFSTIKNNRYIITFSTSPQGENQEMTKNRLAEIIVSLTGYPRPIKSQDLNDLAEAINSIN